MHLIGVALRFWDGGNRLASDVGTPSGMHHLVRPSMVTMSVGGGGDSKANSTSSYNTSIQCKTSSSTELGYQMRSFSEFRTLLRALDHC